MTEQTTRQRKRRMAREPQRRNPGPAATPPATRSSPGKLDMLETLLKRANGATLAEMMKVTGWQPHSVRGAMAGALRKKRGLVITSDKVDGVRRYCAARPA